MSIMPRMSQQQQYLRQQQLTLAKLMFVAGALLYMLSGYFWYTRVFASTGNVFWGMVDGNLKSFGTTQQMSQSNAQQAVTQQQANQLQLGSQAVASGKSNITQSPNTPDQVKIDTEAIGTLSTNYVRYTDISINQKLPNGQMPDFAKSENVWAQEPNTGNGKNIMVNVMFGSLGRMPIGQLNPKQRQELVSNAQDNSVYKIKSSTIKKEWRGLRPVYTYDVEVNVQQYVFMLKKFDVMSGLNQIQSVDPTQFPTNEKVGLKVTVDVLSRNMLSVEYANTKQTERYAGFGAQIPVQLPAQAISVQELEAQLQKTLSGE